MNQLQMLKMALIAYVNSAKAVWSIVAHPLEIFSKKGKNLKDYRIYGNSVQDGVPTPEAPIEVQSVGDYDEESGKYKVPVVVKGKNLYKPTRLSAGNIDKPSSSVKLSNNYGTTISTTDATKGEFTVTQSTAPDISNPPNYKNGFFCFEIGQDVLTVEKWYTLSFDCEIIESLLENNQLQILLNGGAGWYNFYVENGKASVDFIYRTPNSYDNYIEIRLCGKSLKISNIMITEVDSNQDYEPYIEPQTHNLYLNEPLRKLGEHADYIDFEKGVVVRKIRERTIGSVSWDKYSDHTDQSSGILLYRYEQAVNDKRLFVGGWSSKGIVLCNGLKNTHYDGGVGVVDKSISERPYSTGNRSLRILTSQYDTVAKMKEAFGDFKIYYILDDAYITEEKVTLPALPTFKGTTVYEVQTSTEPSGMQACYYE